MLWQMAFLSDPAKISIRDYLLFIYPFTRMYVHLLAEGGGKSAEEWWHDVCGSLAGFLTTIRAAPSINVAYKAAWRLWAQWRFVAEHASL